MRHSQKLTTLVVVGLIILSLSWVEANFTRLFTPQAATAQAPGVRLGEVEQRVYQQLPNLPLENKYVSKETGKVAENSTLVSRLVQYHVYIKGRAPNYRLDWKLTLADYLNANEVMYETSYPGHDTLRQNPIDGDRTAISKLNRQQRDALVAALVSIFTPNNSKTPAPSNTTPSPSRDRPSLPTQPKPGDAQLLKP